MPRPTANVTREPTFRQAQRWWARMQHPVTFVGVPGYPWQPAVLWNAGLLFSPVPRMYTAQGLRLSGPPGLMRELDGFELDALHVEFSFGARFDFPDRMDNRRGRIAQELLDGRMPIVISRLKSGGLAWTRTVFSRLAAGQVAQTGEEVLLTEVCWTARNGGKAARSAELHCHLNAPHVVLGYKVAMRAEALPPPRQLTFEDGLVLDNRRKARLAAVAEGGTCEFDRKLPEKVLSRSEAPLAEWGLDQDVLTFRARLPANRSASARLVVPYFAAEPAVLAGALRTSHQAALRRTQSYWRRQLATAGRINTPERIVNDSFDAYLYHAMLATGRKGRSGHWILKTSPNNYEGLWGAHASIAAFSMDLRGKSEWSRKVFETFLANQGPVPQSMLQLSARRRAESEGFNDHSGFLGNIEGHMAVLWVFYHGWTMWAIGQHARLTGDWRWLKRHAAKLARACEWIASQRRRTKRRDRRGRKVLAYGLLPAANAFDWGFGHMFWSDAHNYRGLKEAAECLRIVGHPKAGRYLAEAERYRQDIVEAVTRSRDASRPVPLEGGTSIPYVPMCVEMRDCFQTDWTYVACGPLNLAWAGVVPADHELIEQTLAYLEAGRPLGKWDRTQKKYQGWDWAARAAADEDFLECTRPRRGRAHLWRHKMTYEPGWIPQAFVYMDRDEIQRLLEHFYSLISNGGQHVELRTPIEQRDGVAWTQPGDANLMWLMRNMLVREDSQRLLLAGTCPRAWLADGQTLGVTKLLTQFGTVSYQLRCDVKRGRITGRLALDFRKRPKQILLRLRHPTGLLPRAVKINGRTSTLPEAEWIALPADSRTLLARY